MSDKSAAKKQRVYEIAKELGISSEVIQKIAKTLGVDVKNHMSTIASEDVEKVRAELGREKAAARVEVVRQQLRDRGMTAQTIEQLGLGYAPQSREGLKGRLAKPSRRFKQRTTPRAAWRPSIAITIGF